MADRSDYLKGLLVLPIGLFLLLMGLLQSGLMEGTPLQWGFLPGLVALVLCVLVYIAVRKYYQKRGLLHGTENVPTD